MPVDPQPTLTMPSAGDESAPYIPRIGEVIDKKYRVDKVLGKGGMGVVVAVTHLQLGELYALKCLLPSSASDADVLARFMREARAAVRIKSEHIAHVSDVGQLPNGAPYILMEYLTGRDLGDVLKEHGPLVPEEAVEYVLQACVGVAEAHALGIIHRDLKPSNLFLTQRLDGAPLIKVLDFGISKTLDERGADDGAVTKSQAVFGSPAYMSPEQLKSAKSVDVRADVWALGVILYRLLTGQQPFEADTWSGLISTILSEPPRSLREIRPDVSEELEAAVLRCLQKDLSQRFQNVAELASALEPFVSSTSRVSIGRIKRLTKQGPQPLAHLSSAAGRKSGSNETKRESSSSHAGTYMPWSTAATRSLPPPKSRYLIFALGAVLAAAATTAVFMFVKPGTPTTTAASSTVAATADPATIAPSAPTTPTANLATNPTAADPAPPSPAAAAAPTTETSTTAQAAPPTVRPPMRPPARPPTTTKPAASTAASAASPPTAPSGTAKLDPAAESH